MAKGDFDNWLRENNIVPAFLKSFGTKKLIRSYRKKYKKSKR